MCEVVFFEVVVALFSEMCRASFSPMRGSSSESLGFAMIFVDVSNRHDG